MPHAVPLFCCPTVFCYPTACSPWLPVLVHPLSLPDKPLKQVQERDKGKLCSQQTQAPAFVGLPRKGTKKVVVTGGQRVTFQYRNE